MVAQSTLACIGVRNPQNEGGQALPCFSRLRSNGRGPFAVSDRAVPLEPLPSVLPRPRPLFPCHRLAQTYAGDHIARALRDLRGGFESVGPEQEPAMGPVGRVSIPPRRLKRRHGTCPYSAPSAGVIGSEEPFRPRALIAETSPPVDPSRRFAICRPLTPTVTHFRQVVRSRRGLECAGLKTGTSEHGNEGVGLRVVSSAIAGVSRVWPEREPGAVRAEMKTPASEGRTPVLESGCVTSGEDRPTARLDCLAGDSRGAALGTRGGKMLFRGTCKTSRRAFAGFAGCQVGGFVFLAHAIEDAHARSSLASTAGFSQ